MRKKVSWVRDVAMWRGTKSTDGSRDGDVAMWRDIGASLRHVTRHSSFLSPTLPKQPRGGYGSAPVR